jgi:S-adenosyl-L-methionine hydrolase (adenosine-forming)
LLTDFGLRDSYVGIMKGVIYGIHPEAIVVDLTHDIRPQDIAAGRFQLSMAVPYFPPSTVHTSTVHTSTVHTSTVHIAVIDPGVGTHRRSIAIRTDRAIFVGPDNGLLVLEEPIRAAVVLNQPQFWRSNTTSTTFQGRDIFAAVGAHLARGLPITAVGEPIDPATLVRLEIQPSCIQAIDHFGNCITNLPGSELGFYYQVGDRILRTVRTYSDADSGEAIVLIGSHGYLEIAINGGNAQLQLGLKIGEPITKYPSAPKS